MPYRASHLPPRGNIQRIIGTVSGDRVRQQRHASWVQCPQRLLELQQVRSLILAMTVLKQNFVLLFTVLSMIDTESRRVVACHIGRQSVGLDQMLALHPLIAQALHFIGPQDAYQSSQTVVRHLLVPNGPASDLFQRGAVPGAPILYIR